MSFGLAIWAEAVEYHPRALDLETAASVNSLFQVLDIRAGIVQYLLAVDANQVDVRVQVGVVVDCVVAGLADHLDRAQFRQGVERVVDGHQRERGQLRLEVRVDHRRSRMRLGFGKVVTDHPPLVGEPHPGLSKGVH